MMNDTTVEQQNTNQNADFADAHEARARKTASSLRIVG
jgi:hypothetical protein